MQEFRRNIRRLNLGINDLQIERMVNHLVVQPGVDVEAGTDAEGNVMSADEKEMATAAAAVADNNRLTFSHLHGLFELRLRLMEAELRRVNEGDGLSEAEAAAAAVDPNSLEAILGDDFEASAITRRSTSRWGRPWRRPSCRCSSRSVYTPQGAVLVLPLQSEALGGLLPVWRRGQGLWHLRIARYFNRLPSSLRRSEELPWHLQRVRRWTRLMHTLSDLKTSS